MVEVVSRPRGLHAGCFPVFGAFRCRLGSAGFHVVVRHGLFGCGSPAGTPTAAAQRGLLQIVRDFCDHSNAVCADCSFPALVRGFAAV